jgi:inosine-uridine nucleoside N-ribohydrolase
MSRMRNTSESRLVGVYDRQDRLIGVRKRGATLEYESLQSAYGAGVEQRNLIANGNLASGVAGWVGVRANISAASNVLTIAGTSGYPGAYKQFPTTPGKLYRLSVNVTGLGGTQINVGAADNAAGGTDIARRRVAATGVVTIDFLALSNTSAAWIFAETAGAPTFTIRDVSCYEVAPNGKSVILDLDLDSDCDDAAALAIACVLHRSGYINLRAVTVASVTNYAAPCARAMLDFYGLTTVPVGQYKGSVLTAASTFNQQVAQTFGAAGVTKDSFPDATTVIRAALLAAGSKSVTLCCAGPLSNISALLSSGADYYSTQTGSALVSDRVSNIVIMGGDYPNSGTPEFNFQQDPIAANAVFSGLTTTPIFCVGFAVGNAVLSGPPLAALSQDNPVKMAYSLYGGGVAKRQSWDPLAVAFACLGHATGVGLGGANGTNTVNNATGANSWTAAAGNVSFASIATSGASAGAVLDYLLSV